VTSEAEYLDNWVDKFDLLCESDYKVGLLGSCFFVGIISTILIVPAFSDSIGRKRIFLLTMIISFLSQLLLIITNSLNFALLLLIVQGMTFPGKNVVGLNLLLEQCPGDMQEGVVDFYMYFEPLMMVFVTFSF
jgi:MFS family permease